VSEIKIKPIMLAGALRGESARVRKAMPVAAMSAGRRFAAHLANETDARGITDRGLFKSGWRVLKTSDGASVYNDAPYAGVIELGARPHKVGREVRELLAAWAMRKLGISSAGRDSAGRYLPGYKRPSRDEQWKQAMAIAWGIAHKIETKGQAPTYMVRDSLPMARQFFAEELVRVLNRTKRVAP